MTAHADARSDAIVISCFETRPGTLWEGRAGEDTCRTEMACR